MAVSFGISTSIGDQINKMVAQIPMQGGNSIDIHFGLITETGIFIHTENNVQIIEE